MSPHTINTDPKPAPLARMNLAALLSSSLAPDREQLFAHLEPAEFLALSAISRFVRDTLQDGLTATCYNIDAKLAKFFADPKAFRHVQAYTEALIGVEFVLAFFANASILDQLEIWVAFEKPGDEKVQLLRDLLEFLANVGWDFRDCWKWERARIDGTKTALDSIPLSISVRCNNLSALAELLKDAPTTADLNLISWNKA